MPDQRPPMLQGDDRSTLMTSLGYLRASFAAKLAGVSVADATRSFVPSGTSLLWLLEHLTLAEQAWVVTRSGAAPVLLDAAHEWADPVARALAQYHATAEQVDAIVESLPFDAPWRGYGEDDFVNLRWIVTHLLEETARHAGHADILRELIDGATGR